MSSNITLLSSAFFTTETMMNNKSSPYLSLSSTLLLIIIAHYKQHDSFANAEPSMIKPLHNIWVSRNVTECNHEKRLRFPLCNHRFLEILSYHLVTFKSQSGCHFYMSGFQNQLEHESSIFVYVLLATIVVKEFFLLRISYQENIQVRLFCRIVSISIQFVLGSFFGCF